MVTQKQPKQHKFLLGDRVVSLETHLVPGTCLRPRTGPSVNPPWTTLKSRSAQRPWTQHTKSHFNTHLDVVLNEDELYFFKNLIFISEEFQRQTQLQNFIFSWTVSCDTHGCKHKQGFHLSLSAPLASHLKIKRNIWTHSSLTSTRWPGWDVPADTHEDLCTCRNQTGVTSSGPESQTYRCW